MNSLNTLKKSLLLAGCAYDGSCFITPTGETIKFQNENVTITQFVHNKCAYEIDVVPSYPWQVTAIPYSKYVTATISAMSKVTEFWLDMITKHLGLREVNLYHELVEGWNYRYIEEELDWE